MNVFTQELSRRMFLASHAGGLGSLALASMLSSQQTIAAESTVQPHLAVSLKQKAKSVICLFQHGGPSQIDLFDEKPILRKHHGKPYPGGALETHFDKQKGNVLGSPFKFLPYGDCGMELCEHLPLTGRLADDICLVRSMNTESVDHEQALHAIHGGKLIAGMPTWGSWVVYGLGTENANLPAYVVLGDPGGLPVSGEQNWSSGWLPAAYQGVPFRVGTNPVFNLQSPNSVTEKTRRNQLNLLATLNQTYLDRHPERSDLAARITNFEVAARMQLSVPSALDLSQETEETHQLYGLDDPETQEYGTRCLTARRLVERGVRFVQIFLSGQPWDTHSKNAEQLTKLCKKTDKPSAALVQDLKRRGLLDETIVLWTGEFGRLPISQGTDGRDHNRRAFSLWLAGGGFRGGYAHGATDDFGYESITDVVTVHDLHATLMHNLGIDHRQLTYPREGRDASLTDADVTKCRVVDALLD
ncbi:MAG: DUF1501 domain-containing protein [Planctomycetales bacterium]|jgi:hypothetical protein|nr:DUF1501 domain-containing protein [Planctomycetales bacterium]